MCVLACDELVGGESKVYSKFSFCSRDSEVRETSKTTNKGAKTGSMR